MTIPTRLRTSSLTVVVAVLLLAVSAQAAEAAAPGWRVMAATGPTNLPPQTAEIQEVTVDASGGSFVLEFDGQSTDPVPFDADPAVVAAALNGLDAISANGEVQVAGGPGNAGGQLPYHVTFGGGLAGQDVPALIPSSGGLTGGAALASVATVVEGSATGGGEMVVYATNVGGGATGGTVTMTVGPLPEGIVTAGPAVGASPNTWECPAASGLSTVTCTNTDSLPAGRNAEVLIVPLAVDGTLAPAQSSVSVSVSGGGASLGSGFEAPIVVSSAPAEPGIQAFWAGAFDENGLEETRAGVHPHSALTGFLVNTIVSRTGQVVPAGNLHDVAVDAPPGFIGNPLVTERCPQSVLAIEPVTPSPLCDLDSVIGLFGPLVQKFGGSTNPLLSGVGSPAFLNEPAPGYAAQFTGIFVGQSRQSVVASVRGGSDYGATAVAPNVGTFYKIYGNTLLLEGSPASAGEVPFLTNPTNCGEAEPVVTISADVWSQRGVFSGATDVQPAVTGCDALSFTPQFTFQPAATSGSTPVATTAHLHVDQAGLMDKDELAAPHLKDSVVTLPEGLSLNPSAANGLEACTTGQIGFRGGNFPMPNPTRFDESAPACPDGSRIGTAVVESPLLEDPLEGTVYLASQGDNPFGSLIAVYLVIDDAKTGITAKLPGKVVPDPDTGRLTATFENNPQLPFEDLTLEFKGGAGAPLATPDVCGDYTTQGVWTPWSAPDSGPPATTDDGFSVSAGCAPSKAQRPFDIGSDAGSASQAAGAFTPFALRLTRADGDQELDSVEVSTPQGLLASLRDVPYCSEAAIAQAVARTTRGDGALERTAPSCPAASRVGSTTVGAGIGPSPYYASGDVYLAGAYKGAPLSLVFVVPAVAGPFDLGVQVVRTALHVDRSTAKVTAVSDTIPKILEGVPLAIQDVRVNLDRPGFTINPTSCQAKHVDTTVRGANGATRTLRSPFHATGCSKLPFKPTLALRLTGRKQVRTGKHPGIRAKVTQTGIGEAGIQKAVVRLPKSLALDPNNAQALCEFDDGTKPDLENHCPKGSIVGRARAKTPLLKDDLAGNVYFVKNIRIDPDTGNEIRTLPMIVVALRGEIAVNLTGESSTTRGGKLVNTFDNVPDAPISRFNLNIKGGKSGIIAVTRTRRAKINLCAGRHIAEVDNDGQNGRRHDFDVRMKTPCSKRQVKRAKRAAKKAARKARNARR